MAHRALGRVREGPRPDPGRRRGADLRTALGAAGRRRRPGADRPARAAGHGVRGARRAPAGHRPVHVGGRPARLRALRDVEVPRARPRLGARPHDRRRVAAAPRCPRRSVTGDRACGSPRVVDGRLLRRGRVRADRRPRRALLQAGPHRLPQRDRGRRPREPAPEAVRLHDERDRRVRRGGRVRPRPARGCDRRPGARRRRRIPRGDPRVPPLVPEGAGDRPRGRRCRRGDRGVGLDRGRARRGRTDPLRVPVPGLPGRRPPRPHGAARPGGRLGLRDVRRFHGAVAQHLRTARRAPRREPRDHRARPLERRRGVVPGLPGGRVVHPHRGRPVGGIENTARRRSWARSRSWSCSSPTAGLGQVHSHSRRSPPS